MMGVTFLWGTLQGTRGEDSLRKLPRSFQCQPHHASIAAEAGGNNKLTRDKILIIHKKIYYIFKKSRNKFIWSLNKLYKITLHDKQHHITSHKSHPHHTHHTVISHTSRNVICITHQTTSRHTTHIT